MTVRRSSLIYVFRRACVRRGGNCDHRPGDCCHSSSCRCNLWGSNCRCQRMGLFQKWGLIAQSVRLDAVLGQSDVRNLRERRAADQSFEFDFVLAAARSFYARFNTS
ncbi:hypothetical protein MSG28_009274 [Choristoneura fumiferana]|uniref:Uncharacterized protein n=1 Tax=Choristoneura fumiferana TaxID=7141 RepID=A0ACC0KXI0_CHOFU|nr:hypothetical protein MSG28_009274 [Choristoneura fumiferana]